MNEKISKVINILKKEPERNFELKNLLSQLISTFKNLTRLDQTEQRISELEGKFLKRFQTLLQMSSIWWFTP